MIQYDIQMRVRWKMDPATMSEAAKKMTRGERTGAVYFEIMEQLENDYNSDEEDGWFDLKITAEVVETDV